MTKRKVKWTIKRFSYITKMLKEDQTESYFYISKRMERIVIDYEVKTIIEAVNDLIQREQNPWLKEVFIKVKNGDKDVSIIINCPIERSKYYQTKERFINKVYQCCICKGLVSYEEILEEDIE